MKKTNRKVPQSVKVQRRIDAALAEQSVMHKRHISALQRQYGEKIALLELNSGTNEKPIVVVQNDTDFKIDKEKLAAVMQKNRSRILPIKTSQNNSGFIVSNWRNWWKWWSARGLALIAFLALTPIPPELLVLLPDHIRMYAIAVTAVCAFMMNFIDQKHDLNPKTKVVNHV